MKERADIPEWEVTIDAEGRVAFAHPKQARAWLKHAHAGEVIVAQFYPHGTKRSGKQSRGFHAMVKPWLHSESRGGWSIETLKLWVLGEVFGYLEMTHPLTGEVLRFPAEPHTSTLTVGQFCELIDRTLELAADEGVILTPPDEWKKLRERQAKKAAKAAEKGRAA